MRKVTINIHAWCFTLESKKFNGIWDVKSGTKSNNFTRSWTGILCQKDAYLIFPLIWQFWPIEYGSEDPVSRHGPDTNKCLPFLTKQL